jgi:Gpi18-like mannosyltransferase
MASMGALQPEQTAPHAAQAEVTAATFQAANTRTILRVGLGATGIWLATRLAYAVFTYFTVVLNQSGSSDARSLFQVWDQFDTHMYLLISRRGHFWVPTAAFFPLYPSLVGGLSSLLGHAAGPIWPAFDGLRLIVALGVANLGTLAAFVGLSLLAWQEYGEERIASLVLPVVAAYPFAFLLTAAYTEGPFLAAVVFTLYFARRGSWRWAALAALIAGLTKAMALALILPLAWEYGRQHGWWR